MKRSLVVLVLAGLLLLTLPVLARDAGSKVVVNNLSEWTIEEFYMTPVGDRNWGDDILGEEVMDPGYALTLTNISCDHWDILVIDEDGDECILEEVDLCGDNANWDITSDELLNCIDDTEE